MATGLTDEQYNDLVDDIASAIEDGFRESGGSAGRRDRSQRDLEDDVEDERRKRLRRQRGLSEDSVAAAQIEGLLSQLSNLPGLKQLIDIGGEFDAFIDDDLLERMQELQNQFGGLAGEAGENFRTGTSLAKTYADAYIGFQEQLAGANQEGNESVAGLSTSLRMLVGDAREATRAFLDMTEGSRGSADGFKFAAVASDDLIKEMAVFGERMDLNRSQITTFLSRELDLGREAGEMLRTSAVFAKRAADITGDSSKEILTTIEALVKDTERYGNVSEAEMAKIGASLRVLGLDYQELNGMVDKFFSFDSAAQSVSALTTVFGVHLDAMEAMRLANSPDRMDFLNYIRDQFLATGKAAEDMTLAEQRLVQQQLGLSSVSAVTRLFDPTADIQSLEDLTAQTKMGAGEFEEAVKELESEVRQFGTGTKDTLDQLADASYRALRLGLQRDVLAAIVQLEELRGVFEPVAQEIGNIGREQFGIGATFAAGSEQLENLAKNQEALNQVMLKGSVRSAEELGEFFEEARRAQLEAFPAHDPEGRTVGERLESDVEEGAKAARESLDREMILMSESFKTVFDGLDAAQTYSREVLEQTTGSLGIAFDDLTEKRKTQLIAELGVTEEVLERMFNDDLENVSERRLAREIQRSLSEAQAMVESGGQAGVEFMQNRIQFLAENYNISEENLRAGMAAGGGQIDAEGGGSDVIFRSLMARKFQTASAAAPAQPTPPDESEQAAINLKREQALAKAAETLRQVSEKDTNVNVEVEVQQPLVQLYLDGRIVTETVIDHIVNKNVSIDGGATSLEPRTMNVVTG